MPSIIHNQAEVTYHYEQSVGNIRSNIVETIIKRWTNCWLCTNQESFHPRINNSQGEADETVFDCPLNPVG